MSPKEQEIAIGELEERVDRLRVLYEQYFLGFEKLEPTVPRKDVDRRFMMLRKEQIRNTAMRFRFNVVTQKFNTYQMYWVRICRQIEEGTFKRHVKRANARFGNDGRPRAADEFSIDVDLADFDVEMDDVLAEANAAANATSDDAPDTEPPAPAKRAPVITVPDPLDELAMAARAELPLRTPGMGVPVVRQQQTTFIHGERRRDALDAPPPSENPISSRQPMAGASLPAGTKPRILRKIGEPGVQPGQPSRMAPAASSAPRIRAVGEAPPAASSGRLPAAPPASAPRIPGAPGAPPPASPRFAPAAPPGSAPQIRPAAPMRAPQPSSPDGLPPMRPPQQTQPEGLPPMRPPQRSAPGGLPPVRPPQPSAPRLPLPSSPDDPARPRPQLPSQMAKQPPPKKDGG